MIAELDEDGPLHHVRQRIEPRQRLDVRALDQLHVLAVTAWGDQHLGADRHPRWLHESRVWHLEGTWICDDAGEGGGGRCLGTAQINLVLFGTGAAWEVTGHGAQANAAGGGGLPHADAAVAARLMQARPGANQLF